MTRKDEFLEKFKALLREYAAEICIETTERDDWTKDHAIVITAHSYNVHHWHDGVIHISGFEINLGEWENGK